jgi:hypothetical protein
LYDVTLVLVVVGNGAIFKVIQKEVTDLEKTPPSSERRGVIASDAASHFRKHKPPALSL